MAHTQTAEGIVFQVCDGDAKEAGGQINALGCAVAEGFDGLHELQLELEFPCLGEPLVQFFCLVGWQRIRSHLIVFNSIAPRPKPGHSGRVDGPKGNLSAIPDA